VPPPKIASSFADMLAAFSPCFTAPSFRTFLHLAAGWVMCINRRTVTGVILAADAVGLKHHTSFHRFFRAARWSVDDVGRVVLGLVLKLVSNSAEVVVALDDTLSRHTCKHISSAGMHRDPLLSTATKVAYHFGHVWVVLAVVIRVGKWDKTFALPVAVRLYRSKRTCKKLGITHRKKTDLAVELICLLHEAIPGRRIMVVGDNGYANREVLCRLPPAVRV
jgi:SRSO17 transposase